MTLEDLIAKEKERRKRKYDKYRRTKKGVITSMFYAQKRSSTLRGHPEPEYSKQEFNNWVLAQENFEELYSSWVNSGYTKDLKPSVDRLVDTKGYSFDNIRLVSWRENMLKALAEGKGAEANKVPILMLNTKGEIIDSFKSITEAGLKLKTTPSCIGKKVKNKKIYKNKWYFRIKEDENI